MSHKDEPRSGTQFLADLSAFAFETDSLPSEQEAEKALREENIDTTELKAWVSERLCGAKARQKLKKAQAKRFSLSARLNELQANVPNSASDLRKRVLDKLQVLANSSPQVAQIYCRKFEETPDEDLPDLEAEITMLDDWDNEESGK